MTLTVINKIKRLEEIADGSCHCATDEQIRRGASSKRCNRCEAGEFLNRLYEDVEHLLKQIDPPMVILPPRPCEPGCDCPTCRQRDFESFNREGC